MREAAIATLLLSLSCSSGTKTGNPLTDGPPSGQNADCDQRQTLAIELSLPENFWNDAVYQVRVSSSRSDTVCEVILPSELGASEVLGGTCTPGGDTVRLQVLSNQACDAGCEGPANPTIAITVFDTTGSVTVEISNEGSGADPITVTPHYEATGARCNTAETFVSVD